MQLKVIAEKLYRSPLGRIMSTSARLIAKIKKPQMIYGYYDIPSGSFRKYTRISDTVEIINRNKLKIGDFIWIGHYSILDASEEITIEEGCQLAGWIGIFTHGSQTSIRLYGSDYVNIHSKERIGYTRGSVTIGAYTFIGASSLVLPGVTIGKGCIIAANSVVNKSIPDYSIAVGTPATIVGSTKELDKPFLTNKEIKKTYYDKKILNEM